MVPAPIGCVPMLPSKQLSWPERFAVTIVPLRGECSTYNVTTWLHERKAIALAVSAYETRHSGEGEQRLYDVLVEPLGRAAADADGTVGPAKGDLADRMEW